jgi:hypothetical protein
MAFKECCFSQNTFWGGNYSASSLCRKLFKFIYILIQFPRRDFFASERKEKRRETGLHGSSKKHFFTHKILCLIFKSKIFRFSNGKGCRERANECFLCHAPPTSQRGVVGGWRRKVLIFAEHKQAPLLSHFYPNTVALWQKA